MAGSRLVVIIVLMAFATAASVFADQPRCVEVPGTRCGGTPPQAAPSSKPVATALPKLLQEVEATYSKAGTLSAKFTQITVTATTQQRKQSSGLIFVRRPDQVRWETLQPEPNLLVSDGKTYWFYTPPFDEDEPGQLIQKPAKEVQSRLANALLSGAFSKERGLKIEAKGESDFVLRPRKGTAGTVQSAEIHVDPQTKIITQVILRHRGGNTAEIQLQDVRLGVPLESQLFQFKAPPNTEVVQE